MFCTAQEGHLHFFSDLSLLTRVSSVNLGSNQTTLLHASPCGRYLAAVGNDDDMLQVLDIGNKDIILRRQLLDDKRLLWSCGGTWLFSKGICWSQDETVCLRTLCNVTSDNCEFLVHPTQDELVAVQFESRSVFLVNLAQKQVLCGKTFSAEILISWFFDNQLAIIDSVQNTLSFLPERVPEECVTTTFFAVQNVICFYAERILHLFWSDSNKEIHREQREFDDEIIIVHKTCGESTLVFTMSDGYIHYDCETHEWSPKNQIVYFSPNKDFYFTRGSATSVSSLNCFNMKTRQKVWSSNYNLIEFVNESLCRLRCATHVEIRAFNDPHIFAKMEHRNNVVVIPEISF
jgi:hypothetical protein